MDNENIQFKPLTKKDYRIPVDLASKTLALHSNHIQASFTPDGVGITFCVKAETVSDDEEGIAFPQASVFLSPGQAEQLCTMLTEGLAEMKRQFMILMENSKTNAQQ